MEGSISGQDLSYYLQLWTRRIDSCLPEYLSSSYHFLTDTYEFTLLLYVPS